MAKKEIVIKPKGAFSFDPGEIWDYRELFYILAWRNVKVRYKQTLLGVAWVLFQPTVTTAIFSIFFGKLAKIPSENLAYPLFVYCGLVFWTFFSNGVSQASTSVVEMGGIIKKVYFPRLIIPVSAIFTAGVDFIISFIPLIVLLIVYKTMPHPATVLFIPLAAIILFLSSSGLGMFLSALNVRYRDVAFLIPFFLQIGLFVTPVIYPLSVIYDYRRFILMVNPLTGVIENFRFLVKGGTGFDVGLLLLSCFISLIIFFAGFLFFKKTERDFADIV